MNGISVMKKLGLVFLIVLSVGNVYLFTINNKKQEDIQEIKYENQELKTQHEQMEEKVKMFAPTEREQHYTSMIEDTKRFVHAAYVQDIEGYKQRRKDAKDIMTDELLDRFFPADTSYQQEIKTKIYEDQYFVQHLEPDQKTIDVIANFSHELSYASTNNIDVSDIYVMVTFKEDEDGKWIATDIKDLDADSQNLIDEKTDSNNE